MARVTLNNINKAIAALGGAEELVRGEGYFYFVGGDTENWEQTSVYVAQLGGMSVEEWIEEYKSLKGSKMH